MSFAVTVPGLEPLAELRPNRCLPLLCIPVYSQETKLVFLTLSFFNRLLLGLLVDELTRMSDDVESSYDLSLFLVLHADDPGIAIAKNAAELYAACTALAPSVGPSVQSCLETIQAYSCAHDIFQHLLELKGLVTTPDSNGCIKSFSPCGIILRRLCLAAQAASFEQLATLYVELEVFTLCIHK